jgi:fructose-bisphosphate aldolase class II
MALHGGTGLSADQFRDLISRGCAKVNISTAIKESYMRSALEHLKEAEAKNKWDPPTLFTHQRDAVMTTAREHIALFGGSGRAWETTP